MGAPTVVLVHGIRASRTMWLRQLEALEAAGVAAVAPDLPGHGRRLGEEFSVPAALDTIEDAAAAADGEVVVVGLSLGSYLALHWAARTTVPVTGVLAAGGSTRPRGPGLAGYQRLAAAIARLPDGGRGLNDALARRALPAAARADLDAGGLTMGVMAAALAGVAKIDPVADLRAIGPVPVWLVNGQWDHFRAEEQVFLGACEQGRLIIVPGATHLVSLVRPVAFSRYVLELVEEVRH